MNSLHIGKDSFERIKTIIPIDTYTSILVIVDENVFAHWSGKIQKRIGKDACYLTIPSGEKNKTLTIVEKIWTTISTKGFDRKSLVINIGGGMVCDIGAFAASTFMRGISFVQVPTTLLAQADAAIGGKTGFNFNGLKNTIGTFAEPVAVVSDTSFLSTLPQKEYRSGFAEIIKHALIADSALFNYLLSRGTKFCAPTALDDKELDKILSASCTIKSAIVQKDPFEQGERKKLNFGHTVGHAIEMACQSEHSTFNLLHGEAIAIGMIAEARMSFLSRYLSEKKFNDIEKLISTAGLPTKVNSSYISEISKKMLFDKKNIRQQIQWVFLEDIGKVKIDVILPEDIITEGLNYILE